MNQTDPAIPLCQVVLTGRRAEGVPEAEFLQRLQARFKMAEPQARAMLRGRVTVKRNVDSTYARQMAQAFVKLGIEAVVEPMAVEPVAVTAEAPATPSNLGFQPPKLQPFTSPLPVIRPIAIDVALPEAAQEDSSASPAMRLRSLGKQRLPKPASGGSLKLLLVTLLCLALPAAWLALNGAMVYGLYWLQAHSGEFLPQENPYAAMASRWAPVAMGGVFALFLLRPLLLWWPGPPAPVKISAQAEPEFVQGIEALCRMLAVSPPREIHASWEARVAANGRALIIGMPLVQALSAGQLVGVLAQEFSHQVSRGRGRCRGLISAALGWLEHCAHGPDDWQARLHGMIQMHEERGPQAAAARVVLLGIHGVRRLMAGLLFLGVRLSAGTLRQMDADADRYAIQVAGSDGFFATARSLRALEHAWSEVNEANDAAWQENHLLRDLPEAVALHARAYKADRLAAIEQEMSADAQPRRWDWHPPNLERVSLVEGEDAFGIYREDAPATELLRGARSLSEQVTLAWYREQGIRFRVDQLRTRAEVLGLAEDRDQHRERLDEYFNGQLQPWPLLPLAVPDGHPAAALGWKESIDEIRQRSPEIARAWGTAAVAEERLPRMRLAATLGLTSQAIGLSLPALRQPQELRGERQQILRRDTAYYKILREGFGYHARRIDRAIASMAAAPRSKAEELRRILVELQRLSDRMGQLIELGEAARLLAGSIKDESPAAWRQALDAFTRDYADGVLTLLAAADGIAQGVTPEHSLGGFLRSRCSMLATADARDAASVLRATRPLAQALQHFYRLALGELVTLCAAAEKANGIEPIRIAPKA